MEIAGFLKTSLIDYPDLMSSVVFTPRCNFNCGFCHNGDLVKNTDDLFSSDQVLATLEKRKHLIDGLVITGGEPTLQPNLYEFIKAVKGLGYSVKLDTNGSRPEVLKQLLDESLIDYVAMDLKNSKHKYLKTIDVKQSIEPIQTSIDLIKSSKIDYEFRSTLMKEHHDELDLHGIGQMASHAKRLVLQQYHFSDKQLKVQEYTAFSRNEMKVFKDKIKERYHIDELIIRAKY